MGISVNIGRQDLIAHSNYRLSLSIVNNSENFKDALQFASRAVEVFMYLHMYSHAESARVLYAMCMALV